MACLCLVLGGWLVPQNIGSHIQVKFKRPVFWGGRPIKDYTADKSLLAEDVYQIGYCAQTHAFLKPQNETLHGNYIVADVTNLDEVLLGLGRPLIQHD